jgi:hypothetical protein
MYVSRLMCCNAVTLVEWPELCNSCDVNCVVRKTSPTSGVVYACEDDISTAAVL